MDEINSGRFASQRIPLSRIMACVKPELLKSLVLCRVFPEVTVIADAADDQVPFSIASKSRASVKEIDSRVSDALHGVKLLPKSTDPNGSVL